MRSKPIPQFEPDSIEARDVQAALSSAGMLWRAEFRPLYLEDQNALGGIQAVESHRALVRSDTGSLLSVHGGQYTPAQQLEVFGGMQALLDAGEARIIRASQVQGGRKVYIEAQIGEDLVPVKVGDTVRQKAIFSNSHDGTSHAQWAYMTERLVCLNGMTRPSASGVYKARHTASIHARLEDWRLEFTERRAALEEQAETFRGFTRRKLNDRALVAYVREVLSEGAAANPAIIVRGVDRIVELAHNAPGADPGTLWGGLNAITYWATHERGRTEDARVTSNLFGNGGDLVERAAFVAREIAERLPSNDVPRSPYLLNAAS